MRKISLFSTVALLALGACQDEKPMTMGGSFSNTAVPLKGLNANRRLDPQIMQSIALLEAENFKEASVFINQALQTQPRSVALHLLNGLVYEKLAETEDSKLLDLAIVGYQNAINIDANNAFALAKLGALEYKNKQFEKAQENFANALLIKPNDPKLLHELAAASYYAYDIKTALRAIQTAEKLRPDDPLIKRSSAMIHAALGEFEVAEKKFAFFEEKVGQDTEVTRVAARLEDWKQLYKSGRIYLAQSPQPGGQFAAFTAGQSSSGGPAEPTIASEATEALTAPMINPNGDGSGDGSGGGDGSAGGDGSGDGSPPLPSPDTPGTSADKPQVIVDAYMLRILESAGTSKGNNILENLSVTLTPGGFEHYHGRAKGSGLSSRATAEKNSQQTNNFALTPSSGFANGALNTNTQNFSQTFTPATSTVNINNKGNFSTNLFSAGLSWAGLTYNLNIANAVDQRTEVTARPSLSAFLQEQSVFFSGVELVQGFSGQYSGTLVTYDIGVTLVVKPVAIEGEDVTLEISVEGSLIDDPSPDLGSTTNVLKTRVDTKVKMKLGETLMLGGMYERVEELSKKGFPGLRDVPIAQYFFSNEATLSARRSVVIMLTPRSPDAVALAVGKAMGKKDISPALAELANRNPQWLETEANLVKIFKFLSTDPVIYNEFRNGDVLPPSWGWEPVLTDQLAEISSFLYY